MMTHYFTNTTLDRCFYPELLKITCLPSCIREKHLKKASAVFDDRECSTSTSGEVKPLGVS